MQWLSTLDIFFVQLILFPPFVISLGVAAAILASRIFIGPLITLISSLELNYWYFSTLLPEADIPPHDDCFVGDPVSAPIALFFMDGCCAVP
ncbi:hypothetical protein [Planococcus rifietoensis]|uniref:hypothetical protein n=1 Tax=Planococcus rifietoensis TaxID=200991 RepID=UPI00384C21C5